MVLVCNLLDEGTNIPTVDTTSMRNAPMPTSFLLLLPLALLLPACNPDGASKPTASGPSLQRFADCGELRTRVAEAWTESIVQSLYGYGYGYALDAGAEDGGDDSGGDGPSSYSETNVQEEGVDEPDLVKTDGDYLYVAHGSELSVVRSWPADETGKIGSVELDGTPFALFLRGDRAAVLATVWEYHDAGGGSESGSDPDRGESTGSGDAPDWAGDSDLYMSTSTRISIIDLRDRSAPEVLREIDLEGWYTDARMIDGDIYVVSNLYAWFPDGLWELVSSLPLPEVDDWSDEAALDEAADTARALLLPSVLAFTGSMSEAELLPEVRDQVPGEDADPVLLTQCTDVYHPEGISSPAVLTVTHVDLDEGDAGSVVTGTGLLSDGWEVYASADNLYIAQTSWWDWWSWDEDMDLHTDVHKFELAGADTRYLGSGRVDGWVLNQYSMSEQDGYLRIATTDFNWWWGDSDTTDPANNVFVLQERDGALEQVGELRGIAPGEQIYSARFMGDVGFLVTFEQMDPLFTLDLSDPTAPRIVGELEVTGYSSYLHPAGEDHLLAVGMEGTETGEILGFQVSLFDISNLAAPTLSDRFLVESDDWSWSESLWDPHAFTYFADTLSVPIYTDDYDPDTGADESFSGLLVLDVDLDAGGLTELGRVDHSDIAASSTCPDDPWDDCTDTGDFAWMRRSVVIEDWLYSISNYGIKVTALRDPTTEVAQVIWYPSE